MNPKSEHLEIKSLLQEAEIYTDQGLFNEALDTYEKILDHIKKTNNKTLYKKVLDKISEIKSRQGFLKSTNLGGSRYHNGSVLEEALALKEKGDLEGAIRLLQKLISQGSEDPRVYYYLAKFLIEIGEYRKAIEILRNALDLPHITIDDYVAFNYLLGQAYEKIRNIDRALEAYRKASHFNSDYLDVEAKIQKLKDIQRKYGRLQLLFTKGLLTDTIYEEAKKIAKEKNMSLEQTLIEEFGISKKDIGAALSRYYGYPFVEFNELDLPPRPSCIEGIKEKFFRENVCIPIAEKDGRIILAIDDPFDTLRLDLVRRVLKAQDLELRVAIKEDIYKFIDYFYGKTGFELPGEIPEVEIIREEEEELEEAEEVAESVVVQLANYILEEAYHRGASDIHIESLSGKRGAQIRFRIDGECHLFKTIPYIYKRPLISRYKIMANLDIAEKRLPQDGKIKFRMKNGRSFELRVATIPTIDNNEDVVMRILAAVEAMPLDHIGLSEENLEKIKKLIEMPYGLFLVVGPTGSGKTTTLHAALGYINRPNKKIWTAEDPVEIVQEGLRQVQVKPKIGLTFARVLRAFLRADPDVIMIGETRDEETARTVIEASLTGHLVFTTLHTNSAPETVTRLLGMGMDPYNFADALLGILAQRLAKRLCNVCKQPYKPSEKEIEYIISEYGYHPVKPLKKEDFEGVTLYKPKGCPHCHNTGYRGRLAIHELLVANDEIRELIVKRAPVHEIRDAAIRNGMLTLKQDGIWKVLAGETDIRQIRAVCMR